MEPKPLPDHPGLLEALFKDAETCLDQNLPLLNKYRMLRAERSSPAPRQDYVKRLEAEILDGRARGGHEVRLLAEYMTDEELETIGRIRDELRAANNARAELSPRLFARLVAPTVPREEEILEALVTPVSRLQREIADRLGRMPRPPESDLPRFEKNGKKWELWYKGVVCLTVSRSDGNNQKKILEVFQESDWPTYIEDPMNDPDKFAQTVRDLQRKLEGKPLVLRRKNTRLHWEARPE
jgi:hypothetical protein